MRLLKLLHFEFSKQAEQEGVSLSTAVKNQACHLQQHLGKLLLNELLMSICNRTAGDFLRMLDEIQVLAERVESIKAPLFYDINRVKGKRSISERDMDHLENIFTVTFGVKKRTTYAQ